MTDRSDSLKDFEEIFNGISNGKVNDTDQTEEYGDSTSSEESFDDMLGKVSNDLEECESGHSLTDVDKALEAAKVEEVEENVEQESKEDVGEMNDDDDDDIFDSLPEEPKQEPEIEKEKVIPNPGVVDVVEHEDGVVRHIEGKVE